MKSILTIFILFSISSFAFAEECPSTKIESSQENKDCTGRNELAIWRDENGVQRTGCLSEEDIKAKGAQTVSK